MKTLIQIISLFIFTMLLFASCKKHMSFPEATQTGANTLGCKINGVVFTPKKKVGDISSAFACAYEYIDNDYRKGYFFQLHGANKTKSPICSIAIGSDSLPITKGEFELKSWKRGNCFGIYSYVGSSGSKDYYTVDEIPGKLTITKFDEINQIVSGTFSFVAISNDRDTICITDGCFDMKYTR